MMEIRSLGRVPYREAEVLQREMAVKRLSGEIPDTLILLEHPPVITMGRRRSEEDLIVTLEELTMQGIEFVQTDRGGRLTYHGPGQLVGYFIFSLGKRSVTEFVRSVEEVLIRVLKTFGLEGSREPGKPGVWVNKRKIASLGLHFNQGVSRHGFALNVACELAPFQLIIPCGIQNSAVTSMKEELGSDPGMGHIRKEVTRNAELVFGHFSVTSERSHSTRINRLSRDHLYSTRP